MSVLAIVDQKAGVPFCPKLIVFPNLSMASLDIRLGGVYFRWQSQDICIVFALIFPLNQDQLQLSQILDDVQYLDAGAEASCDVCARKNFVYFRYLLCPLPPIDGP